MEPSFRVHELPSQTACEPVRAIYMIVNGASGNFYIGSSEHVIRRFRHHVNHLRRGIHHSVKLQWAWKTRSESAFEFRILKIVGPADDLIAEEARAIREMRPAYNFNLDVAENPMKGRRHSPESIEKMSLNRKGKGLGPRMFSAEHRAAISKSHESRTVYKSGPISAEAKTKMASAAKAKFQRGYVNAQTRPVEIAGIAFASVTMAAAHFGKSRSWVNKLMNQGIGRFLDKPDNGCGRIAIPDDSPRVGKDANRSRAIIVDGIAFGSIREACQHFGRSCGTLAYWLQRGRAKYADGSPAPQLRSIYKLA